MQPSSSLTPDMAMLEAEGGGGWWWWVGVGEEWVKWFGVGVEVEVGGGG